MSDERDDLEWEEWMAKTDAQQDAELDRAMDEYARMMRAMSPDSAYRYRRKRHLELCLAWRKHLRTWPGLPVFEKHLRRCQMMLVELRAGRAHGTDVGHG